MKIQPIKFSLIIISISSSIIHSQSLSSYSPDAPVTNQKLVECLAANRISKNPQSQRELKEELNKAIFLQLVPGDDIRSTEKRPGGIAIKMLVLRDKVGSLWIPLFTDWKAIQSWKSTPIEDGMTLGWADNLKNSWDPINTDPTTINTWKSLPLSQTNAQPWAPMVIWKFILKLPVAGVILNPGTDTLRISHDEIIKLNK